jgi:GAF domain-containing protein
MCRNMLTDPQFAPWREEALKRGYASSLVVPLIGDSKAFGTVTIYSREPDAFSPDEVQLLAELAGDLAYGIGALRTRAAHAVAENALRESEQQFRNLADSIPQTGDTLQALAETS